MRDQLISLAVQMNERDQLRAENLTLRSRLFDTAIRLLLCATARECLEEEVAALRERLEDRVANSGNHGGHGSGGLAERLR